MNKYIKDSKKVLRGFMREHYTDERLTWLLAHARDGKLAFFSCCCFIGVATADHTLRGKYFSYHAEPHYHAAKQLSGSAEAEQAYLSIMCAYPATNGSAHRRLIPMILAELKRRRTLEVQPVHQQKEENIYG